MRDTLPRPLPPEGHTDRNNTLPVSLCILRLQAAAPVSSEYFRPIRCLPVRIVSSQTDLPTGDNEAYSHKPLAKFSPRSL